MFAHKPELRGVGALDNFIHVYEEKLRAKERITKVEVEVVKPYKFCFSLPLFTRFVALLDAVVMLEASEGKVSAHAKPKAIPQSSKVKTAAAAKAKTKVSKMAEVSLV